jgi:hypothetical protein
MRVVLMILALAPMALAADAEPEGKLPGKLTVKDLQGGFAGFTGKAYTIEPDGSYTVGNEFRGKLTVTSKGKLDAKALARLAAAVKRYDAATLKDTGKVETNPRVVTIILGKNTATMNLGTTSPLPAPNDKDLTGRFSGVVSAVLEAIPKGRKGGEDR